MAKNSKTTAQPSLKSPAQKQRLRRSAPSRAKSPAAALHQKPASAKPRSAGSKPDLRAPADGASFTFYVNPSLALMCLPADEVLHFPLTMAADLTGVHPEMLRYYCRLGLLGADRAAAEREPIFDQEALHEVRRIEHYRRHLAVSRQALPLVCELRRQAERQHVEIHFLRCP